MKPACLLLSSATVLGAAVPTNPQVNITIERVGNSAIKATLHNPSSSDITVIKTGSILGESPTRKARLTSSGVATKFQGIDITLPQENLPPQALQTLPAGQFTDVIFDLADLYDLSTGGDFDVDVAGFLHYTTNDGNTIAGTIPYSAGKTLHLSGVAATENLHRRAPTAQACTAEQQATIDSAASSCSSLASSAPGGLTDARLDEWFHSHTADTKSTVVGVYNAAGSGCTSNPSCAASDDKGCVKGALGYTHHGSNPGIFLCDSWFKLPASSSGCDAQTTGNVLLHESTHLESGTKDHAYGHDGCVALDTADALTNADTYARLAQYVYAGC